MRKGRPLTGAEQRTVASYDQDAATWAAAHNDPTYWNKSLATFAQHLPAGASILEIGSGSGRDATWFISNGYHYTGTDVSAALLRIAATQNPAGKFCQHTPYELDSLGQFDGIWAVASLIHVPPERIGEALTSAWLALRPGGVIFTALKPGGWPHWTSTEHDGRTYYHWQPAAFSRQLELAGFTVEDTYVKGACDLDRDDRGWGCCIARRPDDRMAHA